MYTFVESRANRSLKTTVIREVGTPLRITTTKESNKYDPLATGYASRANCSRIEVYKNHQLVEVWYNGVRVHVA